MSTVHSYTDPPEPPTRDGRPVDMNWVRLLGTLTAIAALLAAAGLLALAAGAAEAQRARQMAGWGQTTGVVVASEAVPAQARGRFLRAIQAVRIAYTYEVGGQTYTGERVGLSRPPVEAGSAEGQRLLARYLTGAAVTVTYNPDDPSQAVLEPVSSPATVRAGLQLLGLAAAVALVRFLLRNRPYRS